MRKILNRGAKRRLRRKQQSARRLRNRSMIRGLEPLEDRRLLAVTPDGNFGQMFSPTFPGSVTGTVQRDFSIPFGADRAIAVVANYTTTSAISLFIDLDKDGTTDYKLTTQNASPAGFGGANTLGGVHPGVEGETIQATSPPGGPAETLNSTIWIIPLGPSSMSQDVRVTLTGSTSADFIATVGSYQKVNQSDPVGSTSENSGTPPAGPFAFTQLTVVGVDEGGQTLDGTMVLARNPPNNTLTNLVPDPLNADFSAQKQTEVLDGGHMPSSGNFFRGGASTDDDDDTDADVGFNSVNMDWRFDPVGASAFTHVAVEIQEDFAPDAGFVFDFGDAPASYGTTFPTGPFHAPKGATLGATRDAETDGFPSAAANGDDNNVGAPMPVAPAPVNGDDEDGVTNFATNGVALGTPTFISQWMANNTGSVDIEVNLIKDANNAVIPAYITAYIDWNKDGDFKDAGELVIPGAKVSASGTATYSFNIPDSNTVVEGTSYMRVRLSHATMGDPQILPPGGHASSGEVEDYAVQLLHGAEIHGIKFEDIDADGIRDQGEPGLPGVVLGITKGGNPVVDLLGKQVGTVTTDKDGKFWFVNLPAGSYTVTEFLALSDTNGDKVLDAGDTVGGHFVDQGLRPSTATSKDVTLKAGECIDGITFGNYITGSLHGVKFHDLDGDGVFDAGEPRLPGVKFDLYKFVKTTVTIKATGGGTVTKYKWDLVDTAETDVHGEFWFTDLDPGTYEVVEQKNVNTQQSTPQPTKDPNTLNTNPALSDSAYQIVSRREFVWQAGAASRIMDLNGDQKITQDEIDVAKAKGALKVEVLATPAVDAAPADKAQDLWFGNFLLGTINGFKYEDVNRNGKFDAGTDLPLGKAKMDLKDKNGNIVQSVFTNPDGSFQFVGAPAGEYTVSESALTDTNQDGTPDVNQDMVLDSFVESVTIASGSTVKLKHDFANYVYGSIHGVKFTDTNGDGIKDPGEGPLAGVKFDLYKFITTTTKIQASTKLVTHHKWVDVGDATSDSHGEFWFTQLDPGTYEVRERANQTDANGNPLMQTTLQEKTSPVAIDKNNDGDFFDTGEFPGLDPATSLGKFVIVSRREFVWELDPNGLKDTTQFGAVNRPMDGVGGKADGFIDAGELAAGYNKGVLKIEVLASPNNPELAPNSIPGVNDAKQDLWFGDKVLTGTIRGLKYHDVNANGVKDAGEVGLPLVKMLLTGKTSTGAAVSKTALTDGSGIFEFTGLAPSDAAGYTIVEDPASGDAFVDEGAVGKGDGTPDIQQDLIVTGKGTATVVLAGGATKDFSTGSAADKSIWGNYVFGSIHGVKFHDVNGDGIWNGRGTAPGTLEPRLPGIKFDLYKFSKTVVTKFASGKTVTKYEWEDVGNSTSEQHGEFWFVGLLPGKYVVVEQANADWVQTTGQVKDPNAQVSPVQIGLDPDDAPFEIVSRREYVWEPGAHARPIDGMGGPVDGIIDANETKAAYNKSVLKQEVLAAPELWFGDFRAGRINGFKYEDLNHDGIYTPSLDVPMKNVTMQLKGTDSKGNAVNLTTLTAADGTFSFGSLLPSNAAGYTVSESDKTDTNNDGTPDVDQELIIDPSSKNVVLGSGQTVDLDKNLFGNFILGSLHGFKFHDKNGDGKFNAGEEPLKDVVFDLYKFEKTEVVLLASNITKTIFHWNKVSSEKTDTHGEFWFTGLDAGKYQVVEQKGGFDLTTGQPTSSPAPVDNTPTDGKMFLDAKDFQGVNPNSANVFQIRSRLEYVWEFGASKRPRDLDPDGPGGPLLPDGIIDANEIQMAYNKSVLKTEILAAPAPATSTIYDAGGFEAPRFTTTAFGTGQLEGQAIGEALLWQRTIGASPSTATVQNAIFAPGGGTQAVQINRSANAVDRWGVTVNGFPLTSQITINWAMRVDGPSGNPATQFGPFWGVEAYDATTQIGLLGSLGVDGTTGDVLYQEADTGFFAETGATVAFGVWNNFEIRLDYATHQYHVFLNGTFLHTEGFVDQNNVPGGLNHFTDADFAGLTAAGNSGGLTGTAYFDNFSAKDTGVPLAPSLWFGNVMRGTITGFKYEDVDNDGKYVPANGDVPLAGVKMELVDANNKVVQTVVTTGAASPTNFTFTNVLPGTYTVREATSTNTNAGSGVGQDGTPDNQQEMVLDTRVANVTLASVIGGQSKSAGEFRNYVLGSIHGVKFQDADNDGVWDKGELPWGGIKFDLFKLVSTKTELLASNKQVTTYTWQDVGDATSDIHGEFWFTGLDPGSYYTVREQANPNYEQTTGQPTKSPVGVDANKDGDFLDAGDFPGLDPNSANSNAFRILSRQEYVWELDPDRNPLLGGPLVSDGPLYGAYNRPRDLDKDGVISPAEQAMAFNKSILKIQVLANGGANGLDLVFGNNFITGSIHGFKFEDIDADGLWDQANPKTGLGAEPGLGGIWIELRDANGNVALLADGKLARTRTAGGDDPNTPNVVEKKGEFWFTNVLPGTYTIHEVLAKSDSNGDTIPDDEQGMVASTDTAKNGSGPITVLPRQEWVYTPGAAHLTPSQIAKGWTEFFDDGANKNNVNEKLIFGNYISGSIHGFKFLDLNADGKYDPSAMGKEKPFEWGAFELLDFSGKSLGIVYTDENGEFWFEDLKPGKYTVRERPDLIDRNDLDGDGFPDITDKNNDGLPETMGNGIPDTKEGLMISTPVDVTVQIWSREELVWKPGAAMLGGTSTVMVEPDAFPAGTDLTTAYPNVTLTEATSGGFATIRSVVPNFTPTTPTRSFGHDPFALLNDLDAFGFAGAQGVLQAQFHVPVKSVSIDIIADGGNDRGVLLAYDENGVFLGSVSSGLLNDFQPLNRTQTITFNAPVGKSIGFVQIGGDGLSASDVGLDNLKYVVDPLKEEKLVGTQLMWGDFYAGAIHGLKLQQGSNSPAPNIQIQLIDQWGVVIRTTTTNANGEFWFLDVKPGFYTINEVPSPSVLVMATPVPVVVGHAQAIFSADIPVASQMYYPGLQTPVSNHSLTLRNLIEGSIHGLVCNQANQPLAGVTVTLAGPENAQTTTNAQGQFHFNDLTPGAYVVNVNGVLRIVIVGSGEEEVAMAGLASPLDPGQFETLNPDLKFIITQTGVDTAGPRVTSVKASSTQWTEAFLDEIDPQSEGFPIPGGAGQLLTLPWININEIIVKFSENVVIAASDMSLHGVSIANYGGTFSYDPITFTARLLLPNVINSDKLVIHINDTVKDVAGNALDGEWTNGVSIFPSGNSTAGADFNFRFNVLPGDANRNGTLTGTTDGVLGTDVIQVRNAQFQTTADAIYSPFNDVNGSGNVSGVDVVAVRNRQFTGLPTGNPVAPAASGSSLLDDAVDSVFGDSGTAFGKGAVAIDANDDDLLLLAVGSASSDDDDNFELSAASDSGSESEAVGSIDDLFAALGA